MPYKIWIEIEECDEEGDEIEGADNNLAFALPFAASARVDTLQEALNLSVEMHNAINPEDPAEYVTTKEET